MYEVVLGAEDRSRNEILECRNAVVEGRKRASIRERKSKRKRDKKTKKRLKKRRNERERERER